MIVTAPMGVAALAMILVMAVAWLIARITGNGGWIDVFWSFGIGVLGVAFALLPADDGVVAWRRIAVAILVGLWGLRLGAHILKRVRHGPEDARYAGLRAAWGQHYPSRLFGFALVQAVVAVLLALAMRLAAINPVPELRLLDGLGIIVLAAAILGEGIADRQLTAFKADPANHGKVCDQGLWSWSRHPNYFFEWLGWLAYPLLAIGPDGWGWSALLGPVLMYVTLVYLSGIPPLERHMLQSRGEAYRAYQARTSAFLPWPQHR
jgi:steroid 5-alpha reductase family enzyme